MEESCLEFLKGRENRGRMRVASGPSNPLSGQHSSELAFLLILENTKYPDETSKQNE